MNIVSLSTRYIYPTLIVLSLICLYRGHNLPGGGFIGGLLAASAIMLTAITCSWSDALKKMKFLPERYMAYGLFIAGFSGLIAIFFGDGFMTAQWIPTFELPLLGKVKLGTPILFDIGVYLAVIGFTIKCAHALGTYDLD